MSATVQQRLDDPTVSVGAPGVEFSQHDLVSTTLAAASAHLLHSAAADQCHSAVLRSSGGVGAGSWMQLPSLPVHRLPNPHMQISLRSRLFLDLPCCVGTCSHTKKDGTKCGHPLDSKGAHARSCPSGGWVVRRHNAVVSVLAQWSIEECGCNTFQEQVVPNASEDHVVSRMDLVIYSPYVAGGLHVDVTIVAPTSVAALGHGSAVHDGAAAQVAAARKVSKYPGCTVHPFPLEDMGRLGEAAIRLAKMIAPRDGPSRRSAALSRLYQSLGAAVQRANAAAILAAAA